MEAPTEQDAAMIRAAAWVEAASQAATRETVGVEAATLERVVVWVEIATSVKSAGQGTTVEAATMRAAALMEAAA